MNKFLLSSYFRIIGNFDVNTVVEQLQVVPFDFHNKGDVCKYGKGVYGASDLSFALFESDFPLLFELFNKTVSSLKDKTDILISLREKYNLVYYLVAVSRPNGKDDKPSFYIDSQTIDFCHKVGAEIDIDYYD